MNSLKTRKIIESALMLALGFVLSMIKIPIIPIGGSITLASMLPIILIAYRYGPAWGSLVGALHGALQILEGGLSTPPTNSAFSYILVVLLDYIFAWAAVGLLAGLVIKLAGSTRTSATIGGAVGILGRFLFSFISGAIIWGVYAPAGQSPFIYSFVTNALVFLPEIVFTALITFLLFSFPAMRTLFKPVKE